MLLLFKQISILYTHTKCVCLCVCYEVPSELVKRIWPICYMFVWCLYRINCSDCEMPRAPNSVPDHPEKEKFKMANLLLMRSTFRKHHKSNTHAFQHQGTIDRPNVADSFPTVTKVKVTCPWTDPRWPVLANFWSVPSASKVSVCVQNMHAMVMIWNGFVRWSCARVSCQMKTSGHSPWRENFDPFAPWLYNSCLTWMLIRQDTTWQMGPWRWHRMRVSSGVTGSVFGECPNEFFMPATCTVSRACVINYIPWVQWL